MQAREKGEKERKSRTLGTHAGWCRRRAPRATERPRAASTAEGSEQRAASRGREPKHEVSLASARYRALRALDQSGLREPGLDPVWTVGSARRGRFLFS